jgi:DNA-binding response OmpR family regulator
MEGFKLGISDYILKPFTPKDLIERISRVLEGGKK